MIALQLQEPKLHPLSCNAIPSSTPAGVREILTETANRLGAKGRTDELGWGIVDPYKALLAVANKSAAAPTTTGAAAKAN
jgi:hypothetical protein